MRKILLTFTIILLSSAGISAQNLVHIVQIDSTTTVNLNEVTSINYVIEDYAPFAKGTYTSWFFNSSVDATLEYSPSKDLYRFKDCWAPGYDVTFSLNKETMEFVMSSTEFITGYIHQTYGMVTARVYDNGSQNRFDPETSTFYFAYNWTVSAGTFGAGYDTFQVTELCENGQEQAKVAKVAGQKSAKSGVTGSTLQPRTEKPKKTATFKRVTDECITE